MHRINLRDSHFGGETIVSNRMEAVWKCIFEEDPTLVHKSKVTVAKMMSKWFVMKKAVMDYRI